EEVIGSVPESDADICARAVLAARLALPTWSTLAARDRVQYLYALADEFEVHGEQLSRLATQEIGMPITESRATQVKLPVSVLRSTADLIEQFLFEYRDEADNTVVREPA